MKPARAAPGGERSTATNAYIGYVPQERLRFQSGFCGAARIRRRSPASWSHGRRRGSACGPARGSRTNPACQQLVKEAQLLTRPACSNGEKYHPASGLRRIRGKLGLIFRLPGQAAHRPESALQPGKCGHFWATTGV
jgi:hypothetical protein